MSADQYTRKPPAGAPQEQPSKPASTKVRSTRYDWAHDITPGEPPDNSRNNNGLSVRRSLLQRVLNRLRDLFGGGNPFDRDDDPDPMAA